MSKEYCYKSTAIELLGISAKNFEALCLKPDKEVPNPHYRSYKSYLYNRKTIERLIDDPKIIALRPKPRKSVDYASKFKKKYETPNKALFDAATAMFNINRYCKHDTCSSKNRSEIYDLKNKFIKLLYEKGLAEQIYRHINTLPKKECFACDGTGIYDGYEECNRCDGTGIFLDSVDLVFIVFRFKIDGQFFSWHQPQEIVNFSITLTEPDQKANDTEVKPIQISRTKLTEAKALVRWVVECEI